MIRYTFPAFELHYNPSNGHVKTIYPDGTEGTVEPNSEDQRHGKLLGISAGEHKCLHELCHSLIALAMGREYCPIVWAQVHGLPMPLDAQIIEDMVFAMSYFTLSKPMEYADKWRCMGFVQAYTDPFELKAKIELLFNGHSIDEVAVEKD